MPKVVIEGEMSGAGSQWPDQFHAAAQTSCGVLKGLGPQIQWLPRSVTSGQAACIDQAPGAAAVREHRRQGAFPANRVAPVRAVSDPATAE